MHIILSNILVCIPYISSEQNVNVKGNHIPSFMALAAKHRNVRENNQKACGNNTVRTL